MSVVQMNSISDTARPKGDVVIETRDLVVEFPGAEPIRVVEGVNLQVRRGEVLGLVGESGSGKTMTALSLMGLVPKPGKIASGTVQLLDKPIHAMKESELRFVRGRDVGMIFQDPMSGFNPVRTVGSMMIESLRRHSGLGKAEARMRAAAALRDVGIPSPEERLDAYPHQLSGGLRQRCMIALAMINNPSLIIADEPTTALDATIQLQIIRLMKTRVENAAMIMVTHDFGVAAEICDRIAVMYHGRIVETGSIEQVLNRPHHPYSRALLNLVPSFDPERPPLKPIPGSPPPASERIAGCSFAPRCPRRSEACDVKPALAQGEGEHHLFACFNPHNIGGPTKEAAHG
jgi:oligopeptide/dipeptide ABC transporter ATP-binding protein